MNYHTDHDMVSHVRKAVHKDRHPKRHLMDQLVREQEEDADLAKFLGEQARLDHQSMMLANAVEEEKQREREEREHQEYMDRYLLDMFYDDYDVHYFGYHD